jgi:anti-anti-sigma regulatory factor
MVMPIASLVVYLHHEGCSCIASFSGALTATTRPTIDGVADLVADEESVVLDFSRVDVIDEAGTHAIEMLVRLVRVHGGDLQVAKPFSKGESTSWSDEAIPARLGVSVRGI